MMMMLMRMTFVSNFSPMLPIPSEFLYNVVAVIRSGGDDYDDFGNHIHVSDDEFSVCS